MRDTILKLQKENEHLTRELVTSKAGLREEMDKVCMSMYIYTHCCTSNSPI